MVAIMLIGTIMFQMLLFDATNRHDATIRRHAWQTISQTIAIFSAVLIFQAVLGVFEYYVVEGQPEYMVMVLSFLHMTGWLLLLQVVLAWCSGVVAASAAHTESGEVCHATHLVTKAFTILLAHVTGFASIHAWGEMQQSPHFSSSPLTSVLVVPLAFLGLWVLFRMSDLVRQRIIYSDGQQDASEIVWDTETKEGENDVMALTCSFLLVQSIRFAILGALPNIHGKSRIHHTDPLMAVALLLCSILAVVATVLFGRETDTENLGAVALPLLGSLTIIATMSFAWCTLYFVRAMVLSTPFEWLNDQSALSFVVSALIVSMGAFLLIYAADYMTMRKSTDHIVLAADEALAKDVFTVIYSFGIMVGFSWEQAFNESIEVISGKLDGSAKHWAKLGLALAVSFTVLPNWKNYVLPKIMLVDHHESGSHSGSGSDNEDSGLGPRQKASHGISGDRDIGIGVQYGHHGLLLPGMQMVNPHTLRTLRTSTTAIRAAVKMKKSIRKRKVQIVANPDLECSDETTCLIKQTPLEDLPWTQSVDEVSSTPASPPTCN